MKFIFIFWVSVVWHCFLSLPSVSDILTPHYPWQSSDIAAGMLPPHHTNDFGLDPPGHNKENEDDVEAMSTDSSSSSSDSDWKCVCVFWTFGDAYVCIGYFQLQYSFFLFYWLRFGTNWSTDFCCTLPKTYIPGADFEQLSRIVSVHCETTKFQK